MTGASATTDDVVRYTPDGLVTFVDSGVSAGVKPVTVKSGRFKDILSPYRDPAPGELALIQTLIDDSYQDFLGAVVAGRTRFIQDETKKTARIDSIKAVADGRIVHGEQALKAGLVDELGDDLLLQHRAGAG